MWVMGVLSSVIVIVEKMRLRDATDIQTGLDTDNPGDKEGPLHQLQ